jgi:hypothetical protein
MSGPREAPALTYKFTHEFADEFAPALIRGARSRNSADSMDFHRGMLSVSSRRFFVFIDCRRPSVHALASTCAASSVMVLRDSYTVLLIALRGFRDPPAASHPG